MMKTIGILVTAVLLAAPASAELDFDGKGSVEEIHPIQSIGMDAAKALRRSSERSAEVVNGQDEEPLSVEELLTQAKDEAFTSAIQASLAQSHMFPAANEDRRSRAVDSIRRSLEPIGKADLASVQAIILAGDAQNGLPEGCGLIAATISSAADALTTSRQKLVEAKSLAFTAMDLYDIRLVNSHAGTAAGKLFDAMHLSNGARTQFTLILEDGGDCLYRVKDDS